MRARAAAISAILGGAGIPRSRELTQAMSTGYTAKQWLAHEVQVTWQGDPTDPRWTKARQVLVARGYQVKSYEPQRGLAARMHVTAPKP